MANDMSIYSMMYTENVTQNDWCPRDSCGVKFVSDIEANSKDEAEQKFQQQLKKNKDKKGFTGYKVVVVSAVLLE